MTNSTKANSLYRQTAERIYSSLITSNAHPGTRLLPIKTLAKQYKISYLTTQRALNFLQQEGLLVAKRGSGTYVTDKIQDKTMATRNGEPSNSVTIPVTEAAEPDELKSHSIGIILPYWMKEHGELAYHKIIRGFLNGLDTLNWRVEMINNISHEASDPQFIETIITKRLDGVLWLSPQIEHKMNIMRLLDHHLHVVGIGRVFPDLPFDSLFVDFADLAQQIIDRFWQPDKKTVLLLGPAAGLLRDENSCAFAEEFKKALGRQGGQLPDENIGHTAIFTPGCKELEKLTIDFLSQHPDADILACYHEEFLSAIGKLDQQGFWKNPQPVIVSINADFGLRIKQAGRMPVLTVNLPLENLGKAAALKFREKWTTRPEGQVDTRAALPEAY